MTVSVTLAAKCDSGTCTSLQTDLTPLKSCLTDPTATDCTGRVLLPLIFDLPLTQLLTVRDVRLRHKPPQRSGRKVRWWGLLPPSDLSDHSC